MLWSKFSSNSTLRRRGKQISMKTSAQVIKPITIIYLSKRNFMTISNFSSKFWFHPRIFRFGRFQSHFFKIESCLRAWVMHMYVVYIMTRNFTIITLKQKFWWSAHGIFLKYVFLEYLYESKTVSMKNLARRPSYWGHSRLKFWESIFSHHIYKKNPHSNVFGRVSFISP